MIETITTLRAAPVVGRWYMVPAVFMDRYDKSALWWPVHGPRHDDQAFFDFRHEHYHPDTRFLTNRHLRQIGDGDAFGRSAVERAFVVPIHGWPPERPLPYPELRRMQCRRVQQSWPHPGVKPTRALNDFFRDCTAKRGRRGLVCPHQNYPLGQQPVDAAGIITCPLHGLRIRASDGLCLGDVSMSSEAAAP